MKTHRHNYNEKVEADFAKNRDALAEARARRAAIDLELDVDWSDVGSQVSTKPPGAPYASSYSNSVLDG